MFVVVTTGRNTVVGNPRFHVRTLADSYMKYWLDKDYIFEDYIIYLGSEKENKTIRQNMYYLLLIQESKKFLKKEFEKNENQRIFQRIKWTNFRT